MKWIRSLYEWVLSLADKPHGSWALAALSFAEASFFPIPPDPLLLALILPNRKRALWFASICTIASVSGGLFGYYIGWQLWQWIADFFFNYIPGVTEENFNKVQDLYLTHSFNAVFISGFTPIPYKLFTIAAGVCRLPLEGFFIASLCGRGARFFLLSGLVGYFGDPIKKFIDRYFNMLTLVFVVLLVGGFLAIKLFFH